ncbi:MAG TPA: DUF2786 domain-containing protein [Kofleriaceae bacterium]|nr:DUF2786 domain-containing protein [Kofleriaceae bacterium]
MSATVDKIRKLLNLAQNASANENEADTARRLAERLMAAAGISEADIADSATPDADPLATFGAQHVRSPEAGWHGILAVAVARVVGCYVHYSWQYEKGRRERALTWVGTQAQRESAIELHAWLISQVERLAKGAARIAKDHPAGSRAYLGAYRRGLASSIASQAMALGKNREATTQPDTNALARRSAIQNAIAAYEKQHDLRSTGSSYRTRALGAFAAGVNDGRSVRLQHDMAGGSVKRLGAGK